MKTALVIGATGMVGSALLNQMLADNYFSNIVAFTRRPLSVSHVKLQEHIINFDNPAEWEHLVKGDVLFSCLGTTLKTAGSKEAQYKIDYTYQYNFAKAASENGVTHYTLISAAYASPKSKIFYSRMKGELDEAIQKLSFQYITIIRPGQLAGDRQEKRLGEKISLTLLSFVHRIPGLKFLKPIHADIVAKAMIVASKTQAVPKHVYTLQEIFKLAETN